MTVALSPVTVFVGRSGTGKTNFASAIQFLRDYLVGGTHEQNRRESSGVRCATNPTGPIEFEVEFDVPGFDDHFRYTLVLDEQDIKRGLRLEALECGSRTVFRQSRNQTTNARGRPRGEQPNWEVEPPLVLPPQPGPVAFGRLPGLEEVVVAYTALTAGIGVYSFPYDVLKVSAKSNGSAGLADDGGNFLGVMKDIAISLQDVAIRRGITAALRQINTTIGSVELDSIQTPKTAFVGHQQFSAKT